MRKLVALFGLIVLAMVMFAQTVPKDVEDLNLTDVLKVLRTQAGDLADAKLLATSLQRQVAEWRARALAAEAKCGTTGGTTASSKDPK